MSSEFAHPSSDFPVVSILEHTTFGGVAFWSESTFTVSHFLNNVSFSCGSFETLRLHWIRGRNWGAHGGNGGGVLFVLAPPRGAFWPRWQSRWTLPWGPCSISLGRGEGPWDKWLTCFVASWWGVPSQPCDSHKIITVVGFRILPGGACSPQFCFFYNQLDPVWSPENRMEFGAQQTRVGGYLCHSVATGFWEIL